MSMCLDSVHHYRGNEILFHCGFFMGLIIVMNVLSSAGDGDKVQVCGKPCTIKEKARHQDDRLPNLDGISLAEVGLVLKLYLLAPRANQQRRWKSSFQGTAASSGGNVEIHSSLSALGFPHSG